MLWRGAPALARLHPRRLERSDCSRFQHSYEVRQLKLKLPYVALAFKAVKAAIEIQRQMALANMPLPGARRLVLRIGINLGDVIGEGSDIYGEGVNIAARLEPLAEPGGIVISDKVEAEVRGRLGILLSDLGEQQLKNITRPIRAFRVGADELSKGRAWWNKFV